MGRESVTSHNSFHWIIELAISHDDDIVAVTHFTFCWSILLTHNQETHWEKCNNTNWSRMLNAVYCYVTNMKRISNEPNLIDVIRYGQVSRLNDQWAFSERFSLKCVWTMTKERMLCWQTFIHDHDMMAYGTLKFGLVWPNDKRKKYNRKKDSLNWW